MAKRYELSNEQWLRIENLVPGKKGDPGRTGDDAGEKARAIAFPSPTSAQAGIYLLGSISIGKIRQRVVARQAQGGGHDIGV